MNCPFKDPDYHLFYKQDPDPHIKPDPGSKTNQYHLKIKIFDEKTVMRYKYFLTYPNQYQSGNHFKFCLSLDLTNKTTKKKLNQQRKQYMYHNNKVKLLNVGLFRGYQKAYISALSV